MDIVSKIVILILAITIIYVLSTNVEHFETSEQSSILGLIPRNQQIDKNIHDEIRTEFVYDGKKAFDDVLFSDVLLYESNNVTDGMMGIEKCMKQCKGVCVEYGVSGDAFCYPYDDKLAKEKYKEYLIKLSKPYLVDETPIKLKV
jgi:hypothetical protein